MQYSWAFGIEIECYLPAGKTRGQLADAMRRLAGVKARCEGYNHVTPHGAWKLTTDGSLVGGAHGYDDVVEVVSPILAGDAGLEEVRRVARTIEAFGCTVTATKVSSPACT